MTAVGALLKGIRQFWSNNISRRISRSALRANKRLFLSVAIGLPSLLVFLLVLWAVRQNPTIVADSWHWLRVEGDGTESGSTTVRNIGIVVAGVVALVLGLWRSFVAQRQANAAHRQSEVAHQGLLNERYQQGAQMLGDEVTSVRMGGIHALRSLAEQHAEEYHLAVLRMLCAFVRNPPKVEISEVGPMPTNEVFKLREDVQIALDAICGCHELNTRRGVNTLFWLDFREANLNGAMLRNVDLSIEPSLFGNTYAEFVRTHFGADFTGTLLRSAEMGSARFPRATFTGADLYGANLLAADLSGANLEDANLQSAFLLFSDLSGAKLWNADLTNAMLDDADLTGAEFTGSDSRVTKRHARGLTQSQLDEATSDPLNPPKLGGVTDAETGKQLVWRQ